MSVGVCLINRNGIALAADSAGTFSGNKMFYNSMNKVFSLSEKYNYGAITYGSSSLYNVSISQLLKEFKFHLDSQDCLDDFFEILQLFNEFIQSKNSYYKFNIDEQISCNSLIKDLVVQWGNRIKTVLEEDKDVEIKINSILDEFDNEISEALVVDKFDVSSYIKTTYASFFDLQLNIVVPELKKYKAIKDRFWDSICLFFNLSLKRETDNQIGLFFAGYGKNDAFPKYIHIELYTVIGGKAKYKLIESFDESKNSAKIIPLAQNDVILTFCKGISYEFLKYIPQKSSEIICSKIQTLPPSFSEQQKAFLETHFEDFSNILSDVINAQVQIRNVDPILNSVQLIPLSEMASLAENLVNITSLKRTYAIDGKQQTVGGPTDVAILSKGDGFVWIKRKHYFNKELNHDLK